MKLGLGTVQFGIPYGVSNRRGQVSRSEASAILQKAPEAGFVLLDTASQYGESELILGEYVASDSPLRIITKTGKESDPSEGLKRSLENLKRDFVDGLLVHDPSRLAGPDAPRLARTLRGFAEEGIVKKIGVSVYTGEQIDRSLECFRPDIIQLPLNLFDQRLVASGHLQRLKDLNVEIHARSCFLQGLLLMETEALDLYFHRARQPFSRYSAFLRREGLTRLEASLLFIRTIPQVDVLIIGVCSSKELEEIAATWRSLEGRKEPSDMSELAINDETVLNPSLWKLNRAF